MPLVINTNVASLSAQKNLNRAQSALGQSFQRLSSGFRINSASDDAAGLGVSESLKSRIRSFTVAERNTANAISMTRTAEGGLSEVSGIVLRMRELAVQSANGDLTSTDRSYIDTEFQLMKDEIDRVSGSTQFNGVDLLRCSLQERRALRGARIAMVLQDPKFSLNPVMTIGEQVVETLRAHTRISARDARVKALAALGAVQIDQPERVYRLYPHEVSGGMGQRAMIAMMLIANPELLIADEPTSALDVTVQLQLLATLDALVLQRGMGLILISHDLRLVSSFCDRILVMYAGRVVEEVAAGGLADAKHPYTRGLLNCLPRLGEQRHPLPTLDRQPGWAL